MVVFDINAFANINFMIKSISLFQEGIIRLICQYKLTFAMVLAIHYVHLSFYRQFPSACSVWSPSSLGNHHSSVRWT